MRLKEQVQPDKIKLLSPQEVAALGPAKAAALADVCLEWGPFSEADRARALADIDSLALGRLLSQRRVENTTSYWVFLPPFATKAAADKRALELKAAGQKDAFVVDGGAAARSRSRSALSAARTPPTRSSRNSRSRASPVPGSGRGSRSCCSR